MELGEVEAALGRQAGVAEAVVVLLGQAGQSEGRLVAYVVRAAGAEVQERELQAGLREVLPEYMQPAVYVWLERLPLTANGKLDWHKLPEPEAQRREGSEYVAPRTPVEQELAELWRGLLGLSQVGIHDNFFALGGDSILSIQVITRARKAGIYLTPQQIFQYQTIGELASVAVTVPVLDSEQGIITGEAPLTPIQLWFFEQELSNPHHWN